MWFAENKSWSEYRRSLGGFSAIVCKDGSTVWAEDASGKTIASGEAGVDDASVIQSAIDTVEQDLSNSINEVVPKIVFTGTFDLYNKIKIRRVLHLEGGKFRIFTELGFEVFDGDPSWPNPNYIGFERMTIVGNGNDAIHLRYCTNWFLDRIRMFEVRRGLILERTWGDASTMIACDIRGNPDEGQGLVHVITPSNDCTNSFTVISSTFYCESDGRAVFKFEPQANGLPVRNLAFFDVFTEGYGDFFAGASLRRGLFRISTCSLRGSGYLFNIDEAKELDIRITSATGNFHFGSLHYSRLQVDGILSVKRKDVPLISIDEGGQVIISLHSLSGSVNSDVDYIKIGAPGKWYDSIVIRDALFLAGVAGRSIIAFGDSGRPNGCKVVNCIFRNVNYNDAYPSCYALYYQGKQQIVEDCEFWELNNYEVANDLSGFIFKGIKGHALFENSGTATFSGDGATTQFSIAHGLVSTPTKVLVTPMTADAAADFYVTADDTNIYINYKSAPPSGTDNLKFSWYAEV